MKNLLNLMGVKKLPTKIYKSLINKNLLNDLDENTRSRIFHLAVVEFQKYSSDVWDVPTKLDRLGYFLSELRFNPDYKIHFDPILVSSPYVFNEMTGTIETLPTNLFRDFTKIYLNPDKQSFTISYPLPINSERVKYVIVEFGFSEFRYIFKELTKLEDHLERFTEDSYSFKSIEDLSKFINNENQ